jgi:hypothetical protein
MYACVDCRSASASCLAVRIRDDQEMTSELLAISLDAAEPQHLARFWSGLLGAPMSGDPRDGIALLPGNDGGYQLRFVPAQDQKTVQNRMHFDLTSTSPDDQQRIVATALDLGGRHIDIGQGPDVEHVVLADPTRART